MKTTPRPRLAAGSPVRVTLRAAERFRDSVDGVETTDQAARELEALFRAAKCRDPDAEPSHWRVKRAGLDVSATAVWQGGEWVVLSVNVRDDVARPDGRRGGAATASHPLAAAQAALPAHLRAALAAAGAAMVPHLCPDDRIALNVLAVELAAAINYAVRAGSRFHARVGAGELRIVASRRAP